MRRPVLGVLVEEENPATEGDGVATPSIVDHGDLTVNWKLGGVREAYGGTDPIEPECQTQLGLLDDLWIHFLSTQNLAEPGNVALDRFTNRRVGQNRWMSFPSDQVDLGDRFLSPNGTPCHQSRDGIAWNEIAVAKKRFRNVSCGARDVLVLHVVTIFKTGGNDWERFRAAARLGPRPATARRRWRSSPAPSDAFEAAAQAARRRWASRRSRWFPIRSPCPR